MRRPWRVPLAALVLILAPHGAAGAEPGSDLAQTMQAERQQAIERLIGAASAQIESGAIEGRQLAEAFRNRGVGRSYLKQYAEALEDFSRAIEIDQVNPQYYEDRAIAYLKLREFKPASTDLDMALGLDRKRTSSHREKGRLAFYQGDFAEASQEFARAMETGSDEAVVYSAIWLHMALKRGGLPGEAPLGAIAAQLDQLQWPSPILQMFSGNLQPDEAIAAAASRDPRVALLQQCEAYFYAGEQYLIRGERDKARAAFEAAMATGVTEFMEFDWSARELETMAGK
jgi:lipoprotein NlpI